MRPKDNVKGRSKVKSTSDDKNIISVEQGPEAGISNRPWMFNFNDKNDISTMKELSKLTPDELIAEVKFLNGLAYKLGLEEAKEMSRGKVLKVFENKEGKTK